MIGSAGLFGSLRCPDSSCRRPYCHFNHAGDAKPETTATASTSAYFVPSPPVESTSASHLHAYDGKSADFYSSIEPGYSNQYVQYAAGGPLNVEICQEDAAVFGGSGYTGYYSTAPQASYDPNTFGMYYGQSSESYSAYAPVAPSYSTNTDWNNMGYLDQDEQPQAVSVKREPTTCQEVVRKKRRMSEDARDSSRPHLPPELGNDPLLKSLEKHSPTAAPSVSKKAKRQPKREPAAEEGRPVRTAEFNQYLTKITEIDKKLLELQQAGDEKKEKTVPIPPIDVDALFDFDDDDDIPPRPVQKSSSSTSNSSRRSVNAGPSKSIDLPTPSSSDSDVIVIEDSPPKQVPQAVAVTRTLNAAPASTAAASSSKASSASASLAATLAAKRVAHMPAFPVTPKGPPLKTPVQRRQTLTQQLQRRHVVAAEDSSKKQTTIQSSFNAAGKTRVAHSMKPAPKVDPRQPPAKPEPIDLKSRKHSIVVRRKSLQKLIDELSKFMSMADAVEQAQKEEHELMLKTSAQNAYVSGFNGILRKIREINGSMKAKPSHNQVSHLDVMKGKHKGSISVGVNSHCKKNAQRVKELSERELYLELFDRYLLSDEELENNGFPIWADVTVRNLVRIKLREGQKMEDAFVDDKNPFRKCCRCHKGFRLKMSEEDDVEVEDCTYHWGKFWKTKVHATWVPKYSCCGGDSASGGCSLGTSHVTQMNRKSMLSEFVEAPSRRGDYDERSYKLYALDCEMVYTRLGCEVARLSVVNYKGEKVLDELIKPAGELLDSNYRFSGLKPEDVRNAKLDLAGAQERFFEIVNKDSILIGHSLESDLKSMRIVHKNVIDTSVLYPHKQGPPFKRALKNLSSEVLMKIIQEDVTGHDSCEDAQITLQLVLHKLMNE